MKTSKILFSIVLLILMATASLAENIDTTAENYQQTFKRFARVLSEQWGVDPERISGESHFLRDFGADALDVIELVMALEEEFDIEIPDEEWQQITTVNSAIAYIIDKSGRRWHWQKRY